MNILAIVDTGRTAVSMRGVRSNERIIGGIAADLGVMVISARAGWPGFIFGLSYGLLGGTYGIEDKFTRATEAAAAQFFPHVVPPRNLYK